MTSPPMYENDLNAAMGYKGQHPDCTLIVSIENDEFDYDSFWKNPLITSVLNRDHVIMRLSEARNADSFRQFIAVFKIQNYPTIIIFGEHSALITKSWYPYPEVHEFQNYFLPARLRNKQKLANQPNIRTNINDSERVQPPPPSQQQEQQEQTQQPRKTTKISIQLQSGRPLSKTFNVSDTVGELKQWVEDELSNDELYQNALISHTHQPLSSLDDTHTLMEADLCPSAMIKIVGDDALEINVEDGQNDLPNLRNGQRRARIRCGCANACRCFRWFKLVTDFINPWGDNDDDEGNETFWQYHPNPQMARDMRQAMTQMGRQQRFAEA